VSEVPQMAVMFAVAPLAARRGSRMDGRGGLEVRSPCDHGTDAVGQADPRPVPTIKHEWG
jgi:hypothetical protein